jgi:hypothetical protein
MTQDNPTLNIVKDDKKKRRSSKRRKDRARSRSSDISRSRSREKSKSKKHRKKSRSKSTESNNYRLSHKGDENSRKYRKINVENSLGQEASYGSEPSLQDFTNTKMEIGDREQPSLPKSPSRRQNGRLSIYQQQRSERRNIGTRKQQTPTRWDVLNYGARCCLKCLLRFRMLKFFQVVCAVYICIMTYKGGLMDKDTGLVVDQESQERTDSELLL